MCREGHYLKCILTSVVCSLLEIAFYTGHLVGHVCQANNSFLSCFCKRVKGGGFHFDGQDAQVPAMRKSGLSFSERGIRRPRRAIVHRDGCVSECIAEDRQ